MTYKRDIPCNTCGASGVESSEYCPVCHGSGKTQVSKGFFRVADRCSVCGGSGRKTTKICTLCQGAGKTSSSQSINVRIPAGVDTGSSVKLRSKGNGGLGGGPAGDLKLKISVKPHEFYERKGDNVNIKLPITFPEAALGAKVEVPTIEGSTMMTIPAGTQGGQKFKLSGKGFTRPGGRSRGDMYVISVITVPKGLDDESRKTVEGMRDLYADDPRDGLVK
jgi:molecular chaperone DnaJ